MVKKLFISNRYYWVITLIYLFIGAYLLLNLPKGSIELHLNHIHSEILDKVLLGFTYLGDGVSLSIILIYILFRNIYQGIVGFTAFIFSTIITHFCKHYLFSDYERPIRFFKNLNEIYFIKDLEIHAHNSFPSGHTSAAFCVFSILAFVSQNKNLGLGLWVLAFGVSISRIYLMQHFFIDTYFGTLLGIVTASTTYLIFENQINFKNRFSKKLFF